jgi:hypothetical protein
VEGVWGLIFWRAGPEKLPTNECFTAFFSFKLFALKLKVLFNVIRHEVAVSTRTS